MNSFSKHRIFVKKSFQTHTYSYIWYKKN